MPLPSSELRLQTKASAIDDVPSFPDNDQQGSSEGLTFRQKRTTKESRPKPFCVLAPNSAPACKAMNNKQRAMCMEEDESDEESNFESATSQNLIALDAGLHRDPNQEPQEQRESLPMSNSAHPSILRPNKTAGNRVLDPARRVRFADNTRESTESTDAPRTRRHYSMNAGIEDVEMVPVKEEGDQCRLSTDLLQGGVESSSSSVDRVKGEPDHSAAAVSTSPRPRLTNGQAPRPSKVPYKRATPYDIPSIVITAAPACEHQPTVKREDVPCPLKLLTSKGLLSSTREYAAECLTLVHLPTDQLLLHFRRLAHHVLQASGPSFQSTIRFQNGEKETLKGLRDILKDLVTLTMIVKLSPSEVPADEWVEREARCVRRLKAIIRLINEASNAQSAPPRMNTHTRVKVEQGA